MVYSWLMADEMTLKKAMVFLGIKSPITMRKYADSGLIPFRIAIKNRLPWRVFKKSDLVAFKKHLVKDAVRGMSYLPLDLKPKKKK